MMKRLRNNLFIAAIMLLSSLAYAKTGFLFNIAQSGASASADVILCLNGKGPLSCQNYHITAQDLQIRTAAKHSYPAAGIKVLTPGYSATGCTYYPKTGYCLFATSNTTAATIHLNSSTQKTAPGAPTNVTATAGNATATVSWTAPSDGGSPITGYTVTPSSSGSCTVSGTTASCTGLTNGTTYTFSVYATNAIGNGPAANSNSVTPTAPATAPEAPTGVTSSAGASSTAIDVSWRQPVNTGGSSITGYTVTSSPTSSGCTTTGATICTVSGLTSGTSYTFTVTATNSAGTSPASLPTSALAPFSLSSNQTAPSAPRNVTAVAGDEQVTLTWSPPQNYGGEVLTGYTVSSTPTSSGCTTSGSGIGTSTTCTVSGLTNGVSYAFAVTATNSKGTTPYLFGYSSPVTPISNTTTAIVANPSVLALSASGQTRAIQVINNSTTDNEAITSVDTSALSALGVTVTTNTCTNATLTANGGSCFIEIQPGTTVSTYSGGSTPCTSAAPALGTALTSAAVTISTSTSSTTTDVYVVNYGCQYQGGYLFSIDDTTPATGSIGGTIAATAPQNTSGIVWSSSTDSIWGIDDVSTLAIPDPNGSSSPASTLNPGQLNCNGMSDGACNSNNILVMGYSPASSYAEGLCTQPWSNSGATCAAGTSGCYTDWYLPSICEMDASFTNSDSQPCPSTQSMQSNISSLLQHALFWSSTELASIPANGAWYEVFDVGGGSGFQGFDGKVNPASRVWCVRGLTN